MGAIKTDRVRTFCPGCVSDLTIHFGSMRVTMVDYLTGVTKTEDLQPMDFLGGDGKVVSVVVWLCPGCYRAGALRT